MTIEFDCSGCKTSLRLPDEMAGARAKCVQCGAVLTIPSPTAHYWPPGSQQAAVRSLASSAIAVDRAPPAAFPAKPPAQPAAASLRDTQVANVARTVVIPRPAVNAGKGSSNGAPPSPAASGVYPRLGAARPIVLPASPLEKKAVRSRPPRIQIHDILRRTWGIYQDNFRSLIAAGAVLLLIVAAVSAAIGFGFRAAPAVIQFCLPQIVLIWLMLGAMTFTIKTARGHRPSLAVLFGGMPLAGSAVAVWTICFIPLVLVAVACGLAGFAPAIAGPAILLAWGVVVLTIWTPALLVLVDRVASPTESLFSVLRYTKRNFAPLAGLFAISLLVLAAGALPLGLGLPLAVPYVLLLGTVAYLKDRSRRD